MEVFDLVASQYGYTFEDFKAMTLRTLTGCLEMIDIRTHNEFALNANIQGHKVEFKKVTKKVRELTDAEAELMAKVHRDAIRRKFEERNKKS